MLEYDPPALTFLPGGEDGNVEVQMFNATAMQEQAAHDLGTLGLTETRAPGEIDEAAPQVPPTHCAPTIGQTCGAERIPGGIH